MVHNQHYQGYGEPQPSFENGREDRVPALQTWKDKQQTYKDIESWYEQLEKAHYPVMCLLVTLANVSFTVLAFWNSNGYEPLKHGSAVGFFLASLIFIAFTNHHTRKDKDDVRHDD